MTTSSNNTCSPESQRSVPRTRQRLHKPPSPLDVPDINDDAAERKRVLNVLAQRRYRERKRLTRRKAAVGHANASTHEKTSREQPSPLQENVEVVSSSVEEVDRPDSDIVTQSPVLDATVSIPQPSLHSDGWAVDLSRVDLSHVGSSQAALDPTLLQLDSSSSGTPSSLSSLDTSHLSSEDEAALAACVATDPGCLLDLSDLGNFTSQDDMTSSLPWAASLSDGIRNLPVQQDFPDSYFLPVTELILLRACMRIGERIQCLDRMWGIDANSSFNDGTVSSSAASVLPLSWQPTRSQTTVPHHPIVDLMPWPSVRDRLLLIMTLPDSQKPAPVGAGPMAVAQLAYDMEDSCEGLRVWGGDVYDPLAWEVGQVMFEKWWFVFDRQVVDRSNYWRRMRGAPDLKMPNQVEEIHG